MSRAAKERVDITQEKARKWWDDVRLKRDTWSDIAKREGSSALWCKERSRTVLGFAPSGILASISEQDLRAAHARMASGESIMDIEAKRLGVSKESVKTAFIRLGLPTLPPARRGTSQGKIIPTAELDRYYEAVASGNTSLIDLSRDTGHGYATLLKLWKRRGVCDPRDEFKRRSRAANQ